MNAVDLALVLAVDGSASVTYDEFGLIAGGMAAALRDPTIIAGLIGGPAKASLCSLLLWSGAGAQEVITNWTQIASPADAHAFADAVDNMPRIVTRRADRHRRGTARRADPAQPPPRPPHPPGGQRHR